jgi:hypothetical protein
MKTETEDVKIMLDEYSDAAEALLNWIQSQKIDPVDSVPILALALAGMIGTLASGYDKPHEQLLKMAIGMIRDASEAMEAIPEDDDVHH